jgi:5'-nucleotidase
VETFIVLIHEGGWVDADGHLRGPIVPILDSLDPAVDLVISSHTHQRYAVEYDGRLVTQGYADGAAFVDIDLTIDRKTGDVARRDWEIVTTYHDVVTPDPAVQRIVEQAAAAVAPTVTRQVGTAAMEISRLERSPAGETPLGNLVADSQRWMMGTDLAVTSLFSMRSDIFPGPVTWRDLYLVESYRHELMVMTLTGEQLYRLFNQQWTRADDGSELYRPLQVSGIRVVWDARRRMGDRVVSLTNDFGAPIARSRTYTVTVNAYIAGGGDGCQELLAGVPNDVGPTDVDALVAYVSQLDQPFVAQIEGRIRRLE